MIRRLSLLIVVLCLGGNTWAQGAGDNSNAEELIRKGIVLRKQDDDRGALPLLQRAYDIAHTPRAAAQLALVEEALGRWIDAEVHFKEVMRGESDPWVRKNRSALGEAMRTVQGHLGSLEVMGEPSGADVSVDGQAAGRLPLAEPVRVSAGSVQVELRASGYVTAGKTVVVSEGGYQRVFVGLRREPSPVPMASPSAIGGAPPSPSQSQTSDRSTSALRPSLKWIAWGGGAIGLGLGVYGAIANGQRSDTFNAAGCRLQNGVAVSMTTRTYDPHCNDLKNSYESAASLGIVGFVTAGVLGAAGVALWLTEPSHPGGLATTTCHLALGDRVDVGAECALRF